MKGRTSKARAPLSEFVVVDTSPARADRMWSALRPRLEPAAPARRWRAARPLLLAAAVSLVFGAGALFSRQAPRSGWAELQTAGGATSVRLQDGSALTLEPRTSLTVREQSAASVELALDFGRVQCDVRHASERLFRVVAAEHEVLVRGTRFSVELSRERNELAVEVESGRVEVRRVRADEAEALLGAGQRWSVQLVPLLTASPPLQAGNMVSPLNLGTEPDSGVAVPSGGALAPGPSQPVLPAVAVGSEPSERQRPAGERAATGRQGSTAGQSARELLDVANAARRRGELPAAADAYERLLRNHPEDPRVGLAAFELGRIRMDEFHDVHAAILVLQLAVRAAKEAGLREDALARLVRAHEILKDAPQCRIARAQYLEAYPTGTHVLTVLQACEGH